LTTMRMLLFVSKPLKTYLGQLHLKGWQGGSWHRSSMW
jgi:hypothetical protein